VEPRRRRRPGGRLHEHLPGHQAGLVLTELDRFSLPTFDWLRYPEGDDLARLEPVPVWPLADVLDGAASAGFTNVGLDLYTVGAHVAQGGLVDDLGAAFRARGLACSDVGVLPIGAADVHGAAGALAQVASAVGAPLCIAAFFAPVARDEAIRQLRTAAGILAGAEARLALEFASYGALTRLADAVALCDAVGWERCGLLVDTWHFFRTEAPWPLLRSLDGDRVALVHVNDGAAAAGGDPVHDGRSRRLPVGAGTFPLAEFAAALAEIGYRGILSAEVLSDDVRLRPPATGARLLMTALREGWPRPGRPGASYAAGATGSRS
jgi:sugar phosphate isomerase/epimerase